MIDLYMYKVKLVRVIDGNTIVFNIDCGFDIWRHDEHIRLKGINTPELMAKNKEEKENAYKAKSYVESVLVNTKEIYLKTFKDKEGKYGRMLGDILIEYPDHKVGNDLFDLNKELVKNGHAEWAAY